MSLLQVAALETGYEQLQVLWSVDLAVEEGESVLLLGANGAGKTTLLRAVVGLLPAWRGRIVFADTDITRWRPDQRIRHGLAFMSELGVFPTLSIRENLRMGGYFVSSAAARARAEELYELFPALAERRRELAASLSGGQRKMLGVAKALMSQPRLLIMDEPSAGLAPVFVKQVVETLTQVHGRGMALLIAEQNTSFLPLADRGYVLEGGRIVFSGAERELRDSKAVQQAYFGV
ncbi:MAG TPA: ABC transporter ATP-binding protein [Gammaproteobacteria bacterium]|nr:ABC transporter ATP-binding protein [Gammaproteobacteria bacterium]